MHQNQTHQGIKPPPPNMPTTPTSQPNHSDPNLNQIHNNDNNNNESANPGSANQGGPNSNSGNDPKFNPTQSTAIIPQPSNKFWSFKFNFIKEHQLQVLNLDLFSLLARKFFRYDPYSSVLGDHYILGQFLGRGAYGCIHAAKLRTRTQLFGKMCFRCYYSKSKVEEIVSAPDLDQLIEAFREKKNLDGSLKSQNRQQNQNLTMNSDSDSGNQNNISLLSKSLPLGGFKKSQGLGTTSFRLTSVHPSSSGENNKDSSDQNQDSVTHINTTTLGTTVTGPITQQQMSNRNINNIIPNIVNKQTSIQNRTSSSIRQSFSGAMAGTLPGRRSQKLTRNHHTLNQNQTAQSFVTSESFIKRICSYDENTLRTKPSSNDAVRRIATQSGHQSQAQQSMGYQQSQNLMNKNLMNTIQNEGVTGSNNIDHVVTDLVGLESVHEWCYAVKCMKKNSFVQEEQRMLNSLDNRINIVQKILEGDKSYVETYLKMEKTTTTGASGEKSTSTTLTSNKGQHQAHNMKGQQHGHGHHHNHPHVGHTHSHGHRKTSNQQSIPLPPSRDSVGNRRGMNRANSRGSILLRAPLSRDDREMLRLEHYDGNTQLQQNALQLELKELKKKKQQLTSDMMNYNSSNSNNSKSNSNNQQHNNNYNYAYQQLKSVPESQVLKEVKLLALCRHKCVLYLIECFEDNRWLYLVLERCYGDYTTRYGLKAWQQYIVGQQNQMNQQQQNVNQQQQQNLNNMMNEQSLGLAFAETPVICKIMFQVLLALEHIHRLLVIHRDLKPENILFKSPPSTSVDVVLGDFGMALQLQHRGSVCTDLAGSAAFMAPETWTRSYQNFKTDIWSFGVCMYEMLYCSLPYHASSHPEVQQQQRQQGLQGGQQQQQVQVYFGNNYSQQKEKEGNKDNKEQEQNQNQQQKFCDLAYKLGSIGVRLAVAVTSSQTQPMYYDRRDGALRVKAQQQKEAMQQAQQQQQEQQYQQGNNKEQNQNSDGNTNQNSQPSTGATATDQNQYPNIPHCSDPIPAAAQQVLEAVLVKTPTDRKSATQLLAMPFFREHLDKMDIPRTSTVGGLNMGTTKSIASGSSGPGSKFDNRNLNNDNINSSKHGS